MNIFPDAIAVTLLDSDPFISLQTFDQKHGRSQRFFLSKAALQNQLGDDAEGSSTEADLLNICIIARINNCIRFTMLWLHGNYNDDLLGYRQIFFIPVDKVASALAGKKVIHLSYSPTCRDKASIYFTKTAQTAIADTKADKLKRHALKRIFRDSFDYGREEQLVIQQDTWVHGFYFFSTVSQYEGGIALHNAEVQGKDGKPHQKLYYGLHT